MTNHESSKCYYRPGYNRGGNNVRIQNPIHSGTQNNVGTSERARPILGTQPTPLGTIAFKYVEDQGFFLKEIVPTAPYYVEELNICNIMGILCMNKKLRDSITWSA